MRTIETIVGWMVGLIILFLILSRANEANAIINTLGGFITAQTRNLQGVTASGSVLASPSTARMGNIYGFTGRGATNY